MTRKLTRLFSRRRSSKQFGGSTSYWEQRYATGGNSGVGSYAQLAEFKAEIVNAFVERENIRTVIEFGCGDGNQLGLARYPSYLGLDVSGSAIQLCREKFQSDNSKRFATIAEYRGEQAELVLSLDVIYHLVEGKVFETYMMQLCDAATRFMIIYSSNIDDSSPQNEKHVRHRRFSDWIERNRPQWHLEQHIPNRYPYEGNTRTGSTADFFFFIYSR